MIRLRCVLLDAGPLGLASNPKESLETLQCTAWIDALRAAGVRVLVPEIADYEVRRELLRARKDASIARLDQLAVDLGYLRITKATMRRAAAFWAEIRQRGKPTADAAALDADVVLAAQAAILANEG